MELNKAVETLRKAAIERIGLDSFDEVDGATIREALAALEGKRLVDADEACRIISELQMANPPQYVYDRALAFLAKYGREK